MNMGAYPLILIYKYTKNLCNLQTISVLNNVKKECESNFFSKGMGGGSLLRMEIEVVRDGLPWEGK